MEKTLEEIENKVNQINNLLEGKIPQIQIEALKYVNNLPDKREIFGAPRYISDTIERFYKRASENINCLDNKIKEELNRLNIKYN